MVLKWGFWWCVFFMMMLFFTACATAPNPNLSLSNMEGYQIATSRTIDGIYPQWKEFRPFEIRDKYSTWLYGLSNGRVFALEPAMRAEMGESRKASELEIFSHSNFWQATLKVCTLWCYEPRTIIIRGKIWENK